MDHDNRSAALQGLALLMEGGPIALEPIDENGEVCGPPEIIPAATPEQSAPLN